MRPIHDAMGLHSQIARVSHGSGCFEARQNIARSCDMKLRDKQMQPKLQTRRFTTLGSRRFRLLGYFESPGKTLAKPAL